MPKNKQNVGRSEKPNLLLSHFYDQFLYYFAINLLKNIVQIYFLGKTI